MATKAITGAASAAPQALPLDVLLSTIPSLPRPLLARLTARLIDRLDEIDGDPDLEPTGDEQDGNFAEDDEAACFQIMGGAGCPVSDPGEDDHGCLPSVRCEHDEQLNGYTTANGWTWRGRAL